MTGTLKTLALALVAMLATRAALASAAMAEGEQFHSESSTTYFTGENDTGRATTKGPQTFSVTGNTVSCEMVLFRGESNAKTVNSLTLQAEYEECGSAFPPSTEFKMNGCDYVFDASTTTTTGKVHIVCPEGKKIEVISTGCTLEIGTQTPEGGVTYVNETPAGGKNHITFEIALTGIVATKKAGGTFCFLISGKGTYSGNVTMRGYANAAHTEPVATFWE